MDDADEQQVSPRYLEGYPRIKSGEAAKSLNSGKTRCAWQTPEGFRAGHCAIIATSDGHVTIVSTFYRGDLRNDNSIIEEEAANNYHSNRKWGLFICPDCEIPRRSLILSNPGLAENVADYPIESKRSAPSPPQLKS